MSNFSIFISDMPSRVRALPNRLPIFQVITARPVSVAARVLLKNKPSNNLQQYPDNEKLKKVVLSYSIAQSESSH